MIDLKRLRKEKKITQKELAQLLSCGQSFIASVENGRRDLSPTKIEILEREFGNICSYITNDIEEIKPIENKHKAIAPKQHSQTEKNGSIYRYSVCWCRRFFQATNTTNEREADSTLFYDYRERKRDRTVK